MNRENMSSGMIVLVTNNPGKGKRYDAIINQYAMVENAMYAEPRLQMLNKQLHNPNSATGSYYVNACCVKFVAKSLEEFKQNKEVNNMTNKKVLSGVERVVSVCFVDVNGFGSKTKVYDFAADMSLGPISVEDYVVVPTTNITTCGFTVAQVAAVQVQNLPPVTAEVVACFTIKDYLARQEARARKEKLLIEMRKRAESSRELELFEKLASVDEEMAKLLASYKEIK